MVHRRRRAVEQLLDHEHPEELYLRHIEVRANTDGFATALVNETRIPMAANGWFAPIEAGVDGFYGGGGPDCVRASNLG